MIGLLTRFGAALSLGLDRGFSRGIHNLHPGFISSCEWMLEDPGSWGYRWLEARTKATSRVRSIHHALAHTVCSARALLPLSSL